MKITQTGINNLLIIEFAKHGDGRGWFSESYSKKTFEEHGLYYDFVQDNHSYSKEKGTLRGLHFQLDPKSQTKLFRCIQGAVLDVAVDLRKSSPTYKQWFSIELDTPERALLVPKGFAHGFLTLTEDVQVQYKTDDFYSREHDRSIRYDDPDIGVEWKISDPILSEKDLNAPNLKESDVNFL
ncbi:MAG: dTDP-4-dehydrorhamnose 3,5-epimerase [Oscillospiraceae bacterium]|nr:dTDP-4-dehydrorhamnose 3,5-epimerase [Oscillospiraceae bacterium]